MAGDHGATAAGPWTGTGRGEDGGFTLVEVVVALALLALVATAALYAFTHGARTLRYQSLSGTAVTLANDTLEGVASLSPRLVDGATPVLAGRSATAVDAAWNALSASSAAVLAPMYRGFDATATATSTPAVPITATRTVDGVPFTVTTLIGPCYQRTATPDAPCSLLPGSTTDPARDVSGYARMLRAVVVVEWVPGVGSCTAAQPCRYQVVSIVDPHEDLTWNTVTRPLANDDAVTAPMGSTTSIDVLANDMIGQTTSNPLRNVQVVSGGGTLTQEANGLLTFVAPTSTSGVTVVRYSLTDGAGRTSNTATLRIGVPPRAQPDTASAVQATPVTIPVTGNDVGTVDAVRVTTAPTRGSAVAQGTSVVFTPPSSTGTVTFEYAAVDTATGLTSTPAVVTVEVSPYPTPQNPADLAFRVLAGSALPDLGLAARTGNGPGYVAHLVPGSGFQGQLSVNGAPWSSTNALGATVGYTAPTTVGRSTAAFRMGTPDSTAAAGVWSATRTLTLEVAPAPAPDAFTAANGVPVLLDVGANDTPATYAAGGVQIASVSTPSCGSLAGTQGEQGRGVLTFTTPLGSGTCTFTYTVGGTGTSSGLLSAPATVTVRVGP